MQRPVMHPVFRAEDVTAAKKKTPQWKVFFKTKVVGSFKGAMRLLVSSPVKMGRRAEVENRTPIATVSRSASQSRRRRFVRQNSVFSGSIFVNAGLSSLRCW